MNNNIDQICADAPELQLDEGLDAMPCSLFDFMRVIHEASFEWVSVNIHPHVARSAKDTNASYLRKMALWAMATNTFSANSQITGA